MAYQKMIDPKQIQLIHIAKSQLALDDEHYQAIIEGRTKGKKHSSTELTYFEADSVINYFVSLGFEIKSNYIRTAGAARRARWQKTTPYPRQRGTNNTLQNNMGTVILLPSPDQMEMITALVNKITWRFEDGYDRWRKRYMKIDRIKTAQEASNVIEGLKGLLENQIKGAVNG